MLRDVIIHIANEQPLMADLLVAPTPADVCLVCTNIRTMTGKKPVFVDFPDSTFLMPLSLVRFVEIPARAYETAGEDGKGPLEAATSRTAATPGSGAATSPATDPTARPAADDDEPASVDGEAPVSIPDSLIRLGLGEEGLDGDLLRRIHEA